MQFKVTTVPMCVCMHECPLTVVTNIRSIAFSAGKGEKKTAKKQMTLERLERERPQRNDNQGDVCEQKKKQQQKHC